MAKFCPFHLHSSLGQNRQVFSQEGFEKTQDIDWQGPPLRNIAGNSNAAGQFGKQSAIAFLAFPLVEGVGPMIASAVISRDCRWPSVPQRPSVIYLTSSAHGSAWRFSGCAMSALNAKLLRSATGCTAEDRGVGARLQQRPSAPFLGLLVAQ
jgi:hypothetical protein